MAKKQALNLNIPKSTQKAIKKALRSNANSFIAYMEPFTLIKTGALRKSAKATDFTDSSFSVVYGQDYVDYVYHNPLRAFSVSPHSFPQPLMHRPMTQ